MAFEERICSVHDVPDGEARRFTLGKLGVCIVRLGDSWFAINDTCSHQKVSLADGMVDADHQRIECYKHGSCFSLTTGEPDSLPATKAVPVYDLRIDGDDVLVVL